MCTAGQSFEQAPLDPVQVFKEKAELPYSVDLASLLATNNLMELSHMTISPGNVDLFELSLAKTVGILEAGFIGMTNSIFTVDAWGCAAPGPVDTYLSSNLDLVHYGVAALDLTLYDCSLILAASLP